MSIKLTKQHEGEWPKEWLGVGDRIEKSLVRTYSDVRDRPKLYRALVNRYGPDVQIERIWVNEEGRTVLGLVGGPVSTRHAAKKVRLVAGASKESTAQLERFLANEGLAILEWRPNEYEKLRDGRAEYRNVAIASRMPSFDVWLRNELARALPGSVAPTDVELATHWTLADDGDGELASVRVLRGPTYPGDRRRDNWLAAISEVDPAGEGREWHFGQSYTEDDSRHGVISLTRKVDPLHKPVLWPLVPGDTSTVTASAIPIGVDVDGNVVRMKLLEQHLLTGGTPGSGKSGWVNAWLGSVAALDNVAILGIDPKMVELSLWEPRLSALVTSVEHVPLLLQAVLDEARARYAAMAALGVKKLTPEMFAVWPMLAVVMDELAEVTAFAVGRNPEQQQMQGEIQVLLQRLVQLARAAGVSIIAMTQKPMATVVPTTIRDNIQLRTAFATTTPVSTDVILGDGMHDVALAHEIPSAAKGVGYVVRQESRTPVRFRCWWLPERAEDAAPDGCVRVEDVVEATAQKRVPLPWLGRGPLSEAQIEERARELVVLAGGDPARVRPLTTNPFEVPTFVDLPDEDDEVISRATLEFSLDDLDESLIDAPDVSDAGPPEGWE